MAHHRRNPHKSRIVKIGAIALSFINQGLNGIIWLYAGLISLWFVLWLLLADHIWWLGLVNALALYLFLPLGILLPLALLRTLLRPTLFTRAGQRQAKGGQVLKQKRFGLFTSPLMALSIPGVIFSGLWGKHFIPPGLKAPAQSDQSFEVMTFNTLFNNRDTAKIEEMLAIAQPDILALQEIHPKNRDAVLAALVDYPYSIYHPNTDKHTIGLVSRFPILSAEPLPYPPLKRGLKVMVDVDGQPLQVIVTHLTPNLIKHKSWPQYIDETEAWFDQRDQEMVLLTQSIGVERSDSSYPTLVLCDCNMTRTSQNYRDLSRHMADGFRDTGWGLGWTVFNPAFSFPIVRFDYVWYTPNLQVVRSTVGPDANSDHYPVAATVQFR